MTDDRTMPEARHMLTLKQILRRVPVGRSTLLRMEADGRFPRGIMLTGNRKAWFEDEVANWQDKQPRAGRHATAR